MQEQNYYEAMKDSASMAGHQDLVDTHFQSVAGYWKDLYQRDDLFAVIYQQRRKTVLALVDKLGLPPGSRVLEIGCGAGLTTVALAQRGYIVEAIDTVGAMIDMTRRVATEAGVAHRVTANVGDAHHLAFRDGTFSLGVGMGVVPFLHSPTAALREMARVIKFRGHLIVTADNRWRLNYVLDPRCFPGLASARRKMRDVLEGLRLLQSSSQRVQTCMHSIEEFDAFLSKAEFEKLEGITLGFGPFSFLSYRLLPDSVSVRIHQKLQSFADRGFPVLRSTGAQYIVVAEKIGRD